MPSVVSPAVPTVPDNVSVSAPPAASRSWQRLVSILVALAAAPVVALLIWQGVTAQGNPDPTTPNTSYLSAILDTAVLVFREGLESILVLAAITAGLSRKQDGMAAPHLPRRLHRLRGHAGHVVRRAGHRAGHQQQRLRAGAAGRHGAPRRPRPARGHELVFPQGSTGAAGSRSITGRRKRSSSRPSTAALPAWSSGVWCSSASPRCTARASRSCSSSRATTSSSAAGRCSTAPASAWR